MYFTVGQSILIVFIDYGNSEAKPANEIYPIHESLARLPAMAVACTLAEVGFILHLILILIPSTFQALPRDKDAWTAEASEIFNKLLKDRIVEVQFQQSDGQQWCVSFEQSYGNSYSFIRPLHFVKVMLEGTVIITNFFYAK